MVPMRKAIQPVDRNGLLTYFMGQYLESQKYLLVYMSSYFSILRNGIWMKITHNKNNPSNMPCISLQLNKIIPFKLYISHSHFLSGKRQTLKWVFSIDEMKRVLIFCSPETGLVLCRL